MNVHLIGRNQEETVHSSPFLQAGGVGTAGDGDTVGLR